MTIHSLPWHVNVDAPGYEETAEAIEESMDLLVAMEQEYGALLYAGIANEAASMMGYPESIRQQIPLSAQRAAERFVSVVGYGQGRGTGQALYGLSADAHDHLDVYENGDALDSHITEIRERWRNTNGRNTPGQGSSRRVRS